MAVGILNETSLHAALKAWCARPGDEIEARVDGYVVDVRRGTLLIEIQTRGFAHLKDKLARLAVSHAVHLVHPIAKEKYIVRQSDAGQIISRRKSPKQGQIASVFKELVSFPELATRPGFSIEILLTREEEILKHGPGGSWRRKGWYVADRRLLSVLEAHELASPLAFATLLPGILPVPFTSHDLAAAGPYPLPLAQKMVYCLLRMGVLVATGKRRNSVLYARA